jgi:catechol 2,3-dioxygenase-like lactoylglutathione lyase family enzyme
MAATKKGSRGKAAPRAAVRRAPRAAARTASRTPPALAFHHAMVYVRDLARSLAFYRDALGFRVVDEYPGAYARLRASAGDGTIALHVLERGQRVVPATAGVRLYFEVAELERCCAELAGRGVRFTQGPTRMPWGWDHAYLADPDGHELSLFRAGAARLRRTRIGGGR